jgi:predicted transcriptional regulator
MSSGAQKLACFGRDYDPKSFACLNICRLGGPPEKSPCALALAGGANSGVESRSEMIVSADTTSGETQLEETVLMNSEVTEPKVSESAKTLTDAVLTTELPQPVAVSKKARGGSITKKGVIYKALQEAPGGISADDLAAMVIDAFPEAAESSEKTRHYVIMSISNMRKKEGLQIEIEGGKYVLKF